jgi:hypothetical protein
MMSSKAGFLIFCLSFLVVICLPAGLRAQEEQEIKAREKTRDGLFQISLKSPVPRTMIVDELVRDRNLNPGALFRVKTGGYLSFDESEWVDRIEFKVFDRPVTELPQYKRYSELLVDINNKISGIMDMLGRYDQLALRLMNICDKSRFPTLQAIDENIVQQLTVYQRLVLLRELVVNSLNRFVRERSCVDRQAEYQKTLDLYTKRLTELGQNYERLTRRAMQFAQDLKVTAGEQPEGKKAEETPPPPPPPPGRQGQPR